MNAELPRLVLPLAQPHADSLLDLDAGHGAVTHLVANCCKETMGRVARHSFLVVWDLRLFLNIYLLSANSRLMTDRLHHWTFFQRLHSNHVLTFFSSAARCSGSDFMIWSNSANWRESRHGDPGALVSFNIGFLAATVHGAQTFPGLKKTLVNPNLKSLSFNPRALNKA